MMKTQQKGFTLIELMISVAIVGILASVAVPAFTDYIAKSKVSEPVMMLGGIKNDVTMYWGEKGSIPTITELTAYAGNVTTSGEFVSALTSDTSVATNGKYSAELYATGVSAGLNGKKMVWQFTTTDGAFKCVAADTTIPVKYLPASCK